MTSHPASPAAARAATRAPSSPGLGLPGSGPGVHAGHVRRTQAAHARTGAGGVRSRVPEAGMRAVMGRLWRPDVTDGFDAVLAVLFDGAGGFRIAPAGWGSADAC